MGWKIRHSDTGNYSLLIYFMIFSEIIMSRVNIIDLIKESPVRIFQHSFCTDFNKII